MGWNTSEYTKNCPHCGYVGIDVNEVFEDFTLWGRGYCAEFVVACPDCGKMFEVERNVSITYSEPKKKKADEVESED